eukprot:GFKZ01014923.1.p1 GENE.GFKZ01014923.1~~GFKZ01014923.1.p1  ORF type:complete len:488 (+),score=25.61 GFKZ01014923.1:72-1466(+)
MVCNIAPPLPNPGRAHRFCQACDHINHVRRKLCTNCGAPKPSAVRNAVGVRPITEVESSTDRRHLSDPAYRPDYIQTQVVSNSMPAPYDPPNRVPNQSHPRSDPGPEKSTEQSPHQARSLAMKCPGDDIPLLGNAPKTGAHFSAPDMHAMRGFRPGQALLCEPLVNMNSFHTPVRRLSTQTSSAAAPTPQFVTHVDVNHHAQNVDREQYQLPSMQGVATQKQFTGASIRFRSAPRHDTRDARIPRGPVQAQEKPPDEPLAEDVLSLNRPAIDHGDLRRGDRRQPIAHGMRFTGRELNDQNQMQNQMHSHMQSHMQGQIQNQMYGSEAEAHGNSGLMYKQNQDMFPIHQQYRHDRDHVTGQDTLRRDKTGHSAPDPNHHERAFHSQQQQHTFGRTLEPSRISEQPLHTYRNGIDGDRFRHPQFRQVQKPVENVTATTFEESHRHPDESRYALENILMQHKTTRNS